MSSVSAGYLAERDRCVRDLEKLSSMLHDKYVELGMLSTFEAQSVEKKPLVEEVLALETAVRAVDREVKRMNKSIEKRNRPYGEG